MSTEKTPKAVALRYEQAKDEAPRVVARGRGPVAERIMAVAREHNVPLYADPNLVEVLSGLELDLAIPPELYRAVAEVLVFVYRLNRRLGGA